MPNELQVRATFEDTKRNQTKLFSLLRVKIRNNVALSKDEKNEFSSIIANALLSQAWRHCFYNTHDNVRIDLGSTRFFALSLVDVQGSEVDITERRLNKKYRIQISELWNVLYNKCKELSQPALEEAIHMSKESPKREAPTSYGFTAQKEDH